MVNNHELFISFLKNMIYVILTCPNFVLSFE